MDLNADLGEGAPFDAELMSLVTSANVACGAHAGDEETMRSTMALALLHGVSIGAHPGYRDRANFGRREIAIGAAEAAALVEDQLGLARAAAQREGARLSHVKLHGAFYNAAARDPELAESVAAAVKRTDPSLALFALAGSMAVAAGLRHGLRTIGEAFFDRAYRSDGSLVPRSEPGALIADEATAVSQVLQLVRAGSVPVLGGGPPVTIAAETVCVHGDGPRAVAFARRLRAALAEAGVSVRAFGRQRTNRSFGH